MTQDKCIYTLTVSDEQLHGRIREFCHERTQNNDQFSATVTETTHDTCTVEVHGDTYEIPVFEEGLTSIDGVAVTNSEVSPGASQFA